MGTEVGKSRNYCYTLNNFSDTEVIDIRNWLYVKYNLIGYEVGEEGTPHLQGYVEWSTPRGLKVLKKLNVRIHWEICKGTQKHNIDYCKKGGKFEEVGSPKKQGERSDLNVLKDSIVSGTKVVDIMMDNPIIYHQYGRTLTTIEDEVLRRKWRTEMTKCVWIWGGTGLGKSHEAFLGFAMFNPDTHYVVNMQEVKKGWWDGYRQQKFVIINDFRGEIPYAELLNLCDKWPHSVGRRNRMPMPFLSEMIIITSSKSPGGVYKNVLRNESIDQLLRRIEVRKVGEVGNRSGQGNTSLTTIELVNGVEELY